ncbi:MAG TPA: threonine/serine dehydratase [Gemmatimonadaceae bacterium]|nr:threonine/serine dehydratase [Gemmatimonadaceae bacterium]
MSDQSDERTLVTHAEFTTARGAIRGRLHYTPTVSSTYLSDRIGAPIHLKLELFQKTGSFKPRGVLNRLANLTAEERQRGLITLSAGNHAQAVAWAAREYGVRATVVMPIRATQAKVDATRGYGGDVILTEGDLLSTALELQRERNLTLVHPFDCPYVIAGQGTLGLELIEQVPDLETVIVGVGGGGLIAGVSAAIKAVKPNARVIGVEPEGAPGMTRSLERGEPIRLDRLDTIADGLAAPFAGRRNYHHVRALVDDMVLVSDAEIAAAIPVLMERCKIVPEPAGAAAVAALLSGRIAVEKRSTTVAIVSGGNVDRARLAALLA